MVSATKELQNKVIIKYEKSQDGILAWDELRRDFAYDGSIELRLEQLETYINKPFSSKEPGGMAAYIDQFQAYNGELDTIAPVEYSDSKKKRMLLANIRDAEGVAHLIQKCRDDEAMSYDSCAAYLRKNAILIDHTTRVKPPRKLMHVSDHYDSDRDEKPTTMSMEAVTKLFHSMSQESGVKNTYQMFKSKTF